MSASDSPVKTHCKRCKPAASTLDCLELIHSALSYASPRALCFDTPLDSLYEAALNSMYSVNTLLSPRSCYSNNQGDRVRAGPGGSIWTNIEWCQCPSRDLSLLNRVRLYRYAWFYQPGFGGAGTREGAYPALLRWSRGTGAARWDGEVAAV